MNRAERRRWQRNMPAFHRASKGAMETYVVMPQDRARLTMAVLGQEPTAVAINEAITIWTQTVMRPGGAALCLACDTKFGAGVAPAGHAVSLPFANRECAVVSGICAGCAGRDHLQEVVRARLRPLWPDIRSASGGHG